MQRTTNGSSIHPSPPQELARPPVAPMRGRRPREGGVWGRASKTHAASAKTLLKPVLICKGLLPPPLPAHPQARPDDVNTLSNEPTRPFVLPSPARPPPLSPPTPFPPHPSPPPPTLCCIYVRQKTSRQPTATHIPSRTTTTTRAARCRRPLGVQPSPHRKVRV